MNALIFLCRSKKRKIDAPNFWHWYADDQLLICVADAVSPFFLDICVLDLFQQLQKLYGGGWRGG